MWLLIFLWLCVHVARRKLQHYPPRRLRTRVTVRVRR